MAKSSIQVKCGYCGWLLANEYQNIFDHECFKEYDETFDLLNIDENSVATIVRKESETQEDTEPLLPSQFSNIEFDEHLIMAVIDRPPLYDHRLNVKERSKLKKAELYGKKNNQWYLLILNKGISGDINIKDLQKRWKYHRDCYIKARRKIKQHVPSGSSASSAHLKSTYT